MLAYFFFYKGKEMKMSFDSLLCVEKGKDGVLFSTLHSSQKPSLSVSAGVELFPLVITPFPLHGISLKATCLWDLFKIRIKSFWQNSKQCGRSRKLSWGPWELQGTRSVETRFLNSRSFFFAFVTQGRWSRQCPKFTWTELNNTVVTEAIKLLFMPGMWKMPVKTTQSYL